MTKLAVCADCGYVECLEDTENWEEFLRGVINLASGRNDESQWKKILVCPVCVAKREARIEAVWTGLGV